MADAVISKTAKEIQCAIINKPKDILMRLPKSENKSIQFQAKNLST